MRTIKENMYNGETRGTADRLRDRDNPEQLTTHVVICMYFKILLSPLRPVCSFFSFKRTGKRRELSAVL